MSSRSRDGPLGVIPENESEGGGSPRLNLEQLLLESEAVRPFEFSFKQRKISNSFSFTALAEFSPNGNIKLAQIKQWVNDLTFSAKEGLIDQVHQQLERVL